MFGSFARGEAGPTSDLDVLVEFELGRSLFDLKLAILTCLGEIAPFRSNVGNAGGG